MRPQHSLLPQPPPLPPPRLLPPPARLTTPTLTTHLPTLTTHLPTLTTRIPTPTLTLLNRTHPTPIVQHPTPQSTNCLYYDPTHPPPPLLSHRTPDTPTPTAHPGTAKVYLYDWHPQSLHPPPSRFSSSKKGAPFSAPSQALFLTVDHRHSILCLPASISDKLRKH